MANLIDILTRLDAEDPDMMISDGGTDWTVENLLAAIESADEVDTREYSLQTIGHSEGVMPVVYAIHELDDDGFLVSPPVYVQRVAD